MIFMGTNLKVGRVKYNSGDQFHIKYPLITIL